MAGFSRRLKTVAFIGLVWIVVTVVVYLLAVSNPTTTKRAALAFLILTELVTLGTFIYVEYSQSRPAVFRIGAYVSGSLYFIISGATAVTHLVGLGTSVIWLSALEIIWLALLLTFLVLFGAGGKGTSEEDRSVAEKSAALDALIARLEELLNLGSLSDTVKNGVREIIEEVKYFDRNSKVPADEQISQKVGELVNLAAITGPAGDDLLKRPEVMVEEILALINVRGGQASKRGGF
ncbi:MAG: hypothetical protein LBT47_10810 [Deltaproteobacteria bacterium]|jgi:hypothetical protein|nr:hypothetical protein [Deltaproteobacteria bacterium]